MANEIIKIKVETDAKDSLNTLGKLEDHLEDLKNEIKGVEVDSKAFKKLSSEIKSTETRVKNLNKSFEGLDTEALTGEFGKLSGGIASAFTGIAALGGDANESMEQMVSTVAKGMAIAQGFRGAAEAAQASTKVWAVAQKLLNTAMASNPVGAIVAGIAILVGSIIGLVKWMGKLTDVEEENLEIKEDLITANKELSDSVEAGRVKRLANYVKIIKADTELTKTRIDNLVTFGKISEEEATKRKLIADDNLKKAIKGVELEKDILDKNLRYKKQYDDISTKLETDRIAKFIELASKYNSDYSGMSVAQYKELSNIDRQKLVETAKRYHLFNDEMVKIAQEGADLMKKEVIHAGEEEVEIRRYHKDKALTDEENTLAGFVQIKKDADKKSKEDADKVFEEKQQQWRDYYNGLREIREENKSIGEEIEIEVPDLDVDLGDDPEVKRQLALYEHAQKLKLLTEEGEIEAYETEQLRLDEALSLGYMTKETHFAASEELAKAHADKIKNIEEKANKESLKGFSDATKQKMALAATMLNSISQLMDIAQDEDELSRKEMKRRDIIKANISIASAVLGALASGPPPYNFIMAGITGVLGAAQLIKISNATYADGGILSGPSHAQGGIQTPYGELEGGEGVINKASMRNPSLRNLASVANVAGGGSNFGSGDGSIKLSPESIGMIVGGINDKQVYVSETDITETQNKVKVIEDNSKI